MLASFGSSDRQSTTRTRIFVDRFFPLSFSGGIPDIAILHLSKPVTLSSTIKTIRLPGIPNEHFGYAGFGITSVGWGRESNIFAIFFKF